MTRIIEESFRDTLIRDTKPLSVLKSKSNYNLKKWINQSYPQKKVSFVKEELPASVRQHLYDDQEDPKSSFALFKLSPWTLKMNNPKLQSKFLSY